jgi:hypothetical protein
MGSLDGVDRKIEWAYKHLRDLDSEIGIFKGTNPYEIVPKRDPQDPKKVLYIFTKPKVIPESIALRCGDVVHNLRSALDHLACAAVERNGGKVTNQTAFPISRERPPTPAKYKTDVGGRVKGASKSVISLFEKLEPYFGGADEPLRILDYLDVTDKHRELILAFYTGGITYHAPGKMGGASFGLIPRTPDMPELKDGDAIFEGTVDEDRENNPYAEPLIEISLGEPGEIRGEPILPALSNLGKYVEGVIDKFRPLL